MRQLPGGRKSEESSVGAERDPFSAFEQGHISSKKIPNSWYWKFPWVYCLTRSAEERATHRKRRSREHHRSLGQRPRYREPRRYSPRPSGYGGERGQGVRGGLKSLLLSRQGSALLRFIGLSIPGLKPWAAMIVAAPPLWAICGGRPDSFPSMEGCPGRGGVVSGARFLHRHDVRVPIKNRVAIEPEDDPVPDLSGRGI